MLVYPSWKAPHWSNFLSPFIIQYIVIKSPLFTILQAHTCIHKLTDNPEITELLPVDPTVEVPDRVEPCAASPCGPFGQCSPLEDGRENCDCPVGYVGNPFVECRPQCTINSDCPLNLACINQRCVDPCPGSCGINAKCHVLSHQPNCVCPPGYSGNPYSSCYLYPGIYLLNSWWTLIASMHTPTWLFPKSKSRLSAFLILP